MEKQSKPVFCWIAASQCILRHYRFVAYNQDAIAEQIDIRSETSGSVRALLRHYGVLDEHVVYKHADDLSKADSEAISIFRRISTALRFGRPLIIGLSELPDSPLPFKHAVVVQGYNDQTKSLTLLDPARPASPLTVETRNLLDRWQPYPQHFPDKIVYAKHFYYTKPRSAV
jgi:hypothetical protein